MKVSSHVFALSSAVLLTACAATSATDSAKSKIPPDAITIGAVVPLTGDNATLGADQQRGLDLAVEAVNRTGGVLGKKLAVKVENSEGTAPATVNAGKLLVSVDKVPVVIGEYSSGNTIPLGQYLEQQGVVHLNGGSSSPDIAGIGDFSFSTIGLDNVAGRFAADQLWAQGQRSIALMAPNNAYGVGILRATKQAFLAHGGKIATEVVYTEGQPDYRQELQRVRGAKADKLVYTAYGKDAQTINKNAYQLGMNTADFYGLYVSQNIADSDPKVTDGQTGMDVNYIGPDGAAYKNAYKDTYGFDFKSSFSGYSYDAVMLAAKAINKAGSLSPDAIRKALAEIGKAGYDGATGRIRFDDKGQRVEQPYVRVKVADGKLQPTG